jgi:hypothetical protein
MRALRARRAGLAGWALLAAGCAALPPAPPEVQALKDHWSARRAAYAEVRALADVRVVARRADLWPAFTAVFTHTAPDRDTVSGYTPFGTPLFDYAAEGGRFRFTVPDRERAVTGRLDRPPADPGLKLLADLGHLLDGVLGPEAGEGPVRLDRDGRWVVRGGGETVHIRAAGDRITAVSVHRGRREAVRLAFADFRPVGGVECPFRVEATLPALGARVEITVSDWVLTEAEAPAAARVPAGPDPPDPVQRSRHG